MTHAQSVRRSLAGVGLAVLMASGLLTAQQSGQPAPRPAPVQLKVEVVLSRWQADKKVSSLPFTLWPTATAPRGNPVSLRVGVDVPIGTSTVTRGSGAPNQTSSTSTTSSQMNYRNIGTSIDVWAGPAEGGGFHVNLNISDSSIFPTTNEPPGTLRVADRSAFRTFNLSNELVVRDGQTVQFATASDKITGETLKVDVTVNVVK